MDYILYSIFYILFTFITWKKFNLGLFLLFLLLPTYLIRFHLGPLPTTLLEVMIWITVLIWLLKYKKSSIFSLQSLVLKNKLLFVSIAIFLIAATISIFTSVNIRVAAGEWKAFYIEPVLLFLMLTSHFQKKRSLIVDRWSLILFALILSGLATSILAIYQHFTGWMVPHAFWENQNTFRVTAWYGFPNGVGLFLAPLVPLSVYLLIQNWKRLQQKIKRLKDYKIINLPIFQSSNLPLFILVSCVLFLITAPFAIFFAKSTGAMVGITAGIGILLLFNKKTRYPAIILGIIGLLSLFSFSSFSGIREELLLQDRSGQIRIAMWKEAGRLIQNNPIFGAGLASYEERVESYHTTVNGEGIEIFHHPHNLFLTIWVNIGLLGLIGFILILIWFFKENFVKIKRLKDYKIINLPIFQSSNLPIFLLSTMIVIIVMGLVDSPYIKNDLAIFFWLLPALLISNKIRNS